jgi:hypothetical protein
MSNELKQVPKRQILNSALTPGLINVVMYNIMGRTFYVLFFHAYVVLARYGMIGCCYRLTGLPCANAAKTLHKNNMSV